MKLRWWCGFWVCLSWAGRVGAEPSAGLPVRLVLEGCQRLDERQMRRAFLAEIGARLTDDEGPEVTLAYASCADSRVELRVVDPLTRKTLRRRIDLSSAAVRARERLLALAMAELLVASWAELEVTPNPQVQPEGEAPSPDVTRAARGMVAGRRRAASLEALSSEQPERAGEVSRAEVPPVEPPKRPVEDLDRVRNFRILAVGSVRGFFGETGRLWGGGLRLGEERSRTVSWTVDSLIESGSMHGQGASRTYSVDSATFGGSVAFFWRNRWLTGRMGAGLRVGFVSTRARAPEVGNTTVAPWGWPLLVASLSLFAGRMFAVEIGAEAGYALLAVSRATYGGLNGAWYSGQLGVGFLP